MIDTTGFSDEPEQISGISVRSGRVPAGEAKGQHGLDANFLSLSSMRKNRAFSARIWRDRSAAVPGGRNVRTG
jgi:hypothetical protein